MDGVLSESQAFRREVGFGLLAFLGGFVGIAAATIYLHVRYVIPEDGWWGIAGCIRILLEYPLLAGLVVAAGAVTLLNWRHHRLGVYRCSFCGRPLQYRTRCVCRPEEPRHEGTRPSRWRRCRSQIVPVLLTYLALLPPAAGLAGIGHRDGTHPFAIDLLVLHAMTCAMLLAALGMSVEILALFKRGEKLRKRWEPFKSVFAVWPLVVVLCLIAAKLI